MKLIEIHILQSFPVTCLNRDDVGAPKSAVFGGVQRARVSSQCWKRAIRLYAKDLQNGHFGGMRTRFIIHELHTAFQEKGLGEEAAKVLTTRTAEALGKLDSVEKGIVKTLLFFSPAEIRNVVAKLLHEDYKKFLEIAIDEKSKEKNKKKALKDLDTLAKKATKSLSDAVKDAADIALFGRMVADDHSLMVEGAGLFSHALSTHRVSNEIDFFSAVDDSKPEDSEGAGHIGTLEFNSACYYRYVGLNLDLLLNDHLKHFEKQEQDAVLDAFLRATVMAVPNARKNSMFGFAPPVFVLGLKRTGQPLSLVNAFEVAILPSRKGFVAPSMEALENHYRQMRKIYELAVEIETRIPNQNLDTFIQHLLKGTTSTGETK
jgi:CRISPR system Cascade subunit CasC